MRLSPASSASAGRIRTALASSGNMYCTGDPDRAPVRCTEPAAYAHTAGEAAFAAVSALWSGVPQRVDVSMQECQLQSLLSLPGQYALHGRLQKRLGPRIGRTREIWQAKDGFVTFGLRGGPARSAQNAAPARSSTSS